MAGFYIHIPFCRKQCYYCDFHFTVSFKNFDQVVQALKKEIEFRENEFSDVQFETIYLGGGTPSVLPVKEINSIIELVYGCYQILPHAEISLEANPDDLSAEYLSTLRSTSKINRLSIGIQSFRDADLRFLNRQHSSDDAFECIIRSKEKGFDNINVDLIYGIPGMEQNIWQQNLEIFKKLDIPHLSAYHLTIEPKTVLAYYQKRGKIESMDEEESLIQFEILLHFAKENGYDHYEISNFAKPEYYSKHNLGCWNREPYIGIGPSAHSFNLNKRRWNVANNTIYCNSLNRNSSDYFESENIDIRTAYNEYLMTSLRTKHGIDIQYLEDNFGLDFLTGYNDSIRKFISEGEVIKDGTRYYLSDKGKFKADYIISELMVVN